MVDQKFQVQSIFLKCYRGRVSDVTRLPLDVYLNDFRLLNSDPKKNISYKSKLHVPKLADGTVPSILPNCPKYLNNTSKKRESVFVHVSKELWAWVHGVGGSKWCKLRMRFERKINAGFLSNVSKLVEKHSSLNFLIRF